MGNKMYTQEIFGFNIRIVANSQSLTLAYLYWLGFDIRALDWKK